MEFDQQKRIEDATKSMVSEIDAGHLRRMQAVMHRCAAKCCENTTASMESVHKCIQNCSVPLTEAQHFVQEEFSTSQNRLQRCVMECNDEIKDKMGLSPSEERAKKYNLEFEGCAIKCVDKHVANLPTMLRRMKEVLSKKQQQSALYYPS